jgi:site-specific DNA-cytosine methylase
MIKARERGAQGDSMGAVIGVKSPGQGGFSVADPRHAGPAKHSNEFRIVAWDRAAQAVTSAHGSGPAVASAACHDNGWWSVADHRMPTPTDKLIARIRALDGTWHRPFTTLELAALQSLLDPEDSWVPWRLDGESDQAWRERIGNAVPSDAATAIAEVMGETLLLAWAGETLQLSARPMWVRPVAIAIAVKGA